MINTVKSYWAYNTLCFSVEDRVSDCMMTDNLYSLCHSCLQRFTSNYNRAKSRLLIHRCSTWSDFSWCFASGSYNVFPVWICSWKKPSSYKTKGGLNIFYLDCWRVHRLCSWLHRGTASTMFLHFLVLGAFVLHSECYFSEEIYPEESQIQPPTVVIAILARNTAHSLPYYLGALERLNYPKDRITLWWVFLHAAGLFVEGVLLLSDYSSRSKGQ